MPPRPSPQRKSKSPPPEDDVDDGDEDVGEEDDFGLDDDPEVTFGSDPNFNQAVAKAQYIRVYFVKPMIQFIENTTLFPDTKDTLKITVQGLFDKTQVLAKRKNMKLAEIDMEIMLVQARMGFHPADVDNPDLANVFNLMRNLYISFISRSEGGWERELDNRIETSHTQHLSDDRMRQPMGMQKSNYPIWHPRRWI